MSNITPTTNDVVSFLWAILHTEMINFAAQRKVFLSWAKDFMAERTKFEGKKNN